MASQSDQKPKDQIQEHPATKGEKGVAKRSGSAPRKSFIYWPEADQVKDPFFAVKIGQYSCLCGLTPDEQPKGRSLDDEDDLHPVLKRKAHPRLERLPSNGAMTLASSILSRKSISNASEGKGVESSSVAAAAGMAEVARSSIEEETGDLSPTEVEEVRHFRLFESRGQSISAQRELRLLETAGVDPAAIFTAASLEHVRRIGMTYEESLKLLHGRFKDMGTSEKMPELHCEWGLTVNGDSLTMLYSVEEPELDVVLATVALMERDLQKAFNKGIVKAERLGTHRYNEQFWRTWTYSRTAKAYSDNVVIINAMDALDESVSAIWGSYETPSPDAARAQGVAIPPADPGHSRSDHSLTVWQINPLRDPGQGNRRKGFRLRFQVDMKLPSVISSVLTLMPWFAIRQLARSRVSQAVTLFREFVATSHELQDRVKTSRHKYFYESLTEHLGETHKPDISTL